LKRLKIILQSNIFIFLLIVITIFISFIKYKINYNNSIYNVEDNYFEGIIKEYNLEEDKLSLEIKSKENLIANYYLNNKNIDLSNLDYGSKIKVKGTLKVPSNNTIPYCFNYKEYLNNKDIYYVLNIDQILELNKSNNWLYKIKNYIYKRINNIDKKGYIKAFILGNKSDIDSDIYSNYQSIGVTHLFALSGMHISLLSSILVRGLSKLKEYKRYIIIDIILVIYGYIVSFPSSLKRCITFYILNTFNKVFNLEIKSINLLIITISILIIYNYKIIFDIGFQYSSTIVFFILLSSNIIKSSNYLISSIKLSIITFIASIPISLSNYYSINILSIIYNLFYIPYISLIIYPLSLITFLIPIFNNILIILINIMEYISNILEDINILTIYLSFNIYEVLIYYVILFLLIKFNKVKFYIINIIIIVIDLLIPYIDNNSYIYYLDVNQGDSILIISSHKHNVIMIDTGGIRDNNSIPNNIINMLHALNINTIDYLILTHGDYDHMGDSFYLVDRIKLNKVIFNCGELNELEKELINVLDNKNIKYNKCVDKINDMYFLNTKTFDNENDNSSIIYTRINNYNFLFTGDAGINREKEIINKYNIKNIDVLKVGHHGSKTSSSKEFIDMIKPKYSIISVGRKNKYGHPNKEVLNNLNDSKIYRTDKNGSVMFIIKNNKLFIETFSP